MHRHMYAPGHAHMCMHVYTHMHIHTIMKTPSTTRKLCAILHLTEGKMRLKPVTTGLTAASWLGA